MARLGELLHKRVSIDLKDASLEAALKTLSQASGVPIRADEDFRPDVRLTLKLDDLQLKDALEMIATQAGAIIRPDATRTGVLLSKHPNPAPPTGHKMIPWAWEWWFGPSPLPAPARLSPQSITVLDATHFVVLSISQTVGKPVQVGEGENAVSMVLPMAVLTLYRIENGKMVQESSTLHAIPEADVRKLMLGMQSTGWSREGGRGF